jgi:outer membrane lipoprotein-sorting protein
MHWKLFLFFNFISTSIFAQLSALQILETCIQKIETVKNAEYNFTSEELLKNGVLYKSKSLTKFQQKPYCAYLKIEEPDKGVEVLYKDGFNAGKALIHPNGFPYISLSLEPNSNLLLKNGHHSVKKAGFKYIQQIIQHSINNLKNDYTVNDYIKLKGTKVLNARDCYVLELETPKYEYKKYTVLKGENLVKIADKLMINPYVILYKNVSINNYYDVKMNDEILIPSAFCQKSIMYIDKETFLPMMQEVYIENNILFERYQFKNIKLNYLSDKDFDKENPAYKF